MASFIFMIIFLVIALIAAGIAIFSDYKVPSVVGAVLSLIIAAILAFFAFTVTNDEGEAKVLKSWTGEVQGQIVEPGLQTKAPWQSVHNYDIRNQQVVFASADGQATGANGAQVTIQDKEGVSANIDISVRYSIKPDSVSAIYKKYGTQANFVSRFIENDIRAGVRTIPVQYGTIELLTNRAEIEQKITAYLEERWVEHGVQVESVSLQEIRYPEDVQQRFAEAQNARTEVEKANADLEANRVKAESNRVLAESLSETNLEQLKWETLKDIGKNGNLVVVPEDFGGFLNMNK